MTVLPISAQPRRSTQTLGILRWAALVLVAFLLVLAASMAGIVLILLYGP